MHVVVIWLMHAYKHLSKVRGLEEWLISSHEYQMQVYPIKYVNDRKHS